MKAAICKNAASGCDYPAGECIGECAIGAAPKQSGDRYCECEEPGHIKAGGICMDCGGKVGHGAVLIRDGGPVCSRCSDKSVRKQGHQYLCAKHYRFGQMRAKAKQDCKLVPTHSQLHSMKGANLRCPDCSVQMNWLAGDGQSTVATLQHYRDKTMAIVCRSCNTRHAAMPDDSYRDMPKDSKYCPACRQVKSLNEFNADNGRSGPLKVQSKCKACNRSALEKWREKNRDRYNEYQRNKRAERKAYVVADAMLAIRGKQS